MKDIFKSIYLKQKFALMLPESTGEVTDKQKALAMTVAANFAQFNMIMSEDMVAKLSEASEKDIIDFYKFYEPQLKDMIGADFEGRRLFYPGFPEEVMNKDRFEIFLDQLVYAFSGLTMMPEEKPDMTYFPYLGQGFEKKLNIGTEEEFDEYIKGLFKREILWTPTEKEIINAIVDNKANFLDYFPEEPSKIKENNLLLLDIVKKKANERFMGYATKYLKTPTDVLRYAVSLVDGDISLNGKMAKSVEIKKPWAGTQTKDLGFSFSRNKKYPDVTRNLSKAEIREVLTLLENTRMDIGGDYKELLEQIQVNAEKDGRNTDIVLVDDAVQTYSQYYKSLAKVAHINPEDTSSQVNRVLGAICSNKTRTIMSLIEQAISDKDVETALKYLKYRPTELGRRMDKLCEIAGETGKDDLVLAEYRKIAEKSSVSNLLQMHGTFESRKFLQESRVISVGGKVTEKPAKQPLKKKLCDEIQEIVEAALKEKFKNTPHMGKVYVDKSMSKVKIPKNNRLREASETLYPYTFGSSLPASPTKTKQFAIKWENGTKSSPRERIDLDLSSTCVDKNGNTLHIGWNSHYSSGDRMIVYSGDIQHGGAAEFINCDLDLLRKAGVTGVIPTVNIFCGARNYSEMLDCQMIMAERNDMDYGKTYEAKSVRMSLIPKTSSRQISPMVLNVKTGEWIWLDSLVENKEGSNVASNNIGTLASMVREALMVNEYNPGFDLLIKSQNCELVDSIEDADFVFTQEPVDASLLKEGAQNITQVDYDKLVEYLSDTREEPEKEIETPSHDEESL